MIGKTLEHIVLCLLLIFVIPAGASDTLTHDWGGHIKAQGSLLVYDDQSIWSLWNDDRGHDQSLSLRLKDTVGFGGHLRLETHYQAEAVGGDTHTARRRLSQLFPGLMALGDAPDDRRRLFDLSRTIDETDDYRLHHRLDRLSLACKASWGECRLGRQAVTWGNGLIFNPMDVFNPFAPTDTQRDYKTGDDLASLSLNAGPLGEVQMLYVPRRDPVSGHVKANQSSFAAKSHRFAGELEMDLMGAAHYDECMAGLGLSGSVGGTTLRSDLIWSGLRHSRRDETGYLSGVINVDYSWIWWDKNLYGLLEYYHNGLGHHDAVDAVNDPDLIGRIARSELFVLGRNYLGGLLQIELHPLVTFNLSLIASVDDASTIVQPRLAWDMAQNLSAQWGVMAYTGGHGSEFGGLAIPGTNLYTTSPDSTYLIVSWYF